MVVEVVEVINDDQDCSNCSCRGSGNCSSFGSGSGKGQVLVLV